MRALPVALLSLTQREFLQVVLQLERGEQHHWVRDVYLRKHIEVDEAVVIAVQLHHVMYSAQQHGEFADERPSNRHAFDCYCNLQVDLVCVCVCTCACVWQQKHGVCGNRIITTTWVQNIA